MSEWVFFVLMAWEIHLSKFWYQDEGGRMFLWNLAAKNLKNECAKWNSKWPPFWCFGRHIGKLRQLQWIICLEILKWDDMQLLMTENPNYRVLLSNLQLAGYSNHVIIHVPCIWMGFLHIVHVFWFCKTKSTRSQAFKIINVSNLVSKWRKIYPVFNETDVK